MASSKIKRTYNLDSETIYALESLARRWGASRSEALRRAVRAAAQQSTLTAVDALNELQTSLNLSPADAHAWTRQVRGERHSGSGLCGTG